MQQAPGQCFSSNCNALVVAATLNTLVVTALNMGVEHSINFRCKFRTSLHPLPLTVKRQYQYQHYKREIVIMIILHDLYNIYSTK